MLVSLGKSNCKERRHGPEARRTSHSPQAELSVLVHFSVSVHESHATTLLSKDLLVSITYTPNPQTVSLNCRASDPYSLESAG